MASNNSITVVGNLVRDPELKETYKGKKICRMTVAHNRWVPENKAPADAYFFDVVCFSGLADNVAESLRKGNRVVVYGALQQRSLESDTGQRINKIQILAEDVAPSLRYATAEVRRNQPRNRQDTDNYFDEPM